ncbi:hypothetical protein FDP41_003061 [Naegleria fowleri]|uniref:Uncharacterized protein n=1 Tax=Naegleria fowleri TaxID=5763 RepID=A0A6A5BXS5_NAEFO|nr:uncharacterized protein FDP41_003061 [Naegleria fowleri]KAF0977739.1 hypothetical protein FDP41_003061 [Naegleria fowleri]
MRKLEQGNHLLLAEEENGEQDHPKELTIDNIKDMMQSIEKNVIDLKDALDEVSLEKDVNSEELISELRLALEQSEMLLEKIENIEIEYKKAIKTDSVLPADVTDLAEQLGFIVPTHLTRPLMMDELTSANEPTQPNTMAEKEEPKKKDKTETSAELEELKETLEGPINENDYKFVSFDELEKYLAGPLSSEYEGEEDTSIKTPQVDKEERNIQPSNKKEETFPVTPEFCKELQKEVLKSSVNVSSKASFQSPESNVSISPSIHNDTEIEENSFSLTEEQQQLIEEQDVNHLLKQLQLFTQGFGSDSPNSTTVSDVHREKPVSSPFYHPRTINPNESTQNAHIEDGCVNNERSIDDTLLYKQQVENLAQQLEALSQKLVESEKEKELLRNAVEDFKKGRDDLLQELNALREKEKKFNVIADSLGEHIEFQQGTIEKLKNERDSKYVKQSEQLTLIIETLIRKENTLLNNMVEQLQSEVLNRKVVLNEEMSKIKQLVLQCLGSEDDQHLELNESDITAFNEELNELEDGQYGELQYNSSDPNDEIDIAVVNALNNLKCPVPIEIERIGPGEYFCDRKIVVKLGPNGEALVKNGNSFLTLSSYIKRLYAPFFTTEKQLVEESHAGRNQTDVLLQKIAKTREFVSNVQNKTNDTLSLNNASPPISPRRTSPQQYQPSDSASVSSSLIMEELSPRHHHVQQAPNQTQKESKQENRPSSAPPKNNRYISILHQAEKNKKLRPIKPAPQTRRPPPNSMLNDRRNSPLPPNYVMRNNDLLFVKNQTSAYHFEDSPKIKKPITNPKNAISSMKVQGNVASTQSSSTIFGGVDLSDPKQLAKMKKEALKMQIRQFSHK